MKLLGKIRRQLIKTEDLWRETPQAMINALLELKAVPIKYHADAGYSRWIIDQDWTIERIDPTYADQTA